jgi:hypothetical protein
MVGGQNTIVEVWVEYFESQRRSSEANRACKIPADVNARDEDWLDQTPLHDAHHPREVRRLLDAGADIEARMALEIRRFIL